MKKVLLYALLLLLAGPAQGQYSAYLPDKPHEHSFAMGIYAHTLGTGVLFRSLGLGPGNNLELTLAFGSYRRMKENKIESLYSDFQGKDFFYDKKNYVWTLHVLGGISRDIIPASGSNKLNLRGAILCGPALGFLKPYYIDVAVMPPGATTPSAMTVPYDASQWSYNEIIGESEFFIGFNEMRVVPGARLQAEIGLDFSGSAGYLRAIEFGAYCDYFFRELEIFDSRENSPVHAGFMVGLTVGNSW